MPEEDGIIFGEAFKLYEKYRSIEMKEKDWTAFSDEAAAFAGKWNWRERPLAKQLAVMLLDVLGEMYAGGKKPEIRDYFGRGDL